MIPSPRLYGIPCWMIPISAGFLWLLTLTCMLTIWVYEDLRRYPEMLPEQSHPYISDVGASHLGKPVFQIGSFVTVVTFGIAYHTERWLRQKGLLLHHDSRGAAVLSRLATMFTVIGASGLILLTIFDTRRHPQIHNPLIAVFILGYILAAVPICMEKALLHAAHPHNSIILRSFRIKFAFIVAEIFLCFTFTYTFVLEIWSLSVMTEWFIALTFTLYMWSFAIDFLDVPTLTVIVEDAGAEVVQKGEPHNVRLSLGGRELRKITWDVERRRKSPARRGVVRIKDLWSKRKRGKGSYVRLK